MKLNTSYINFSLGFILLLLSVWACTPKMAPTTTTTTEPEPSESTGESWRANPPKPSPAPAFNLGAYDEFELTNGTKVIVVENHKLPIVSFSLFLDNGPILEGEKTGLASIAGQMMRRGSTKRTKEELDEAIDFIAATLSTNSSGFYASSLKKHTDELLKIASEILFHPSFPESEFEKIIQETKTGLAFNKSDPNTISANVSRAINYGKDHAYGEFETEETIDNLTVKDVEEYYKTYFIPNNAYIVVVGDITLAEAKPLMESYFGQWTVDKNFKPHTPNFTPPPAQNSVSFIPKSGAVQSVINITSTLNFPHNAEDRMEASVMNTILGGYFGSRLNKNIREDKGYTYGIRSNLSPDRFIGQFTTGASVRNEVTDSTITEILSELKKIQTEKVSEEELTLVKNVLTGQFARGLESPQTLANYALSIARYDLPKDYYQTYLKRLSAVTPDDILAAAKKYLTTEQLNIVIVGNEDEVPEKLKAFDSDGKIDFYDTEANPIEIKKESLDITVEEVINRYINAVGGLENIKKLNSVIMSTKAETPQGDIMTTMKLKDNTKVNMKVMFQNMTVQEIVFNGLKAKVGGMQGSQIIDDPKEFNQFKTMAKFFPELDYFTSGEYKLSLKGTEELDGEKMYKVQVQSIDGNSATEYYHIDNGLKYKKISIANNNGQEITTEQSYADYTSVEGGLKVPYTITFSGGGMPFEMVQKVQDIEINPEIDDSEFSIE